MNCKKCGEPLQENENICAKCGTDNRDVVKNISATPNSRRFSSKKNITIIALAGVLALGIGGTAAAFGISNAPANRVSRYMGAAERYLSEMNYEQAIIEFQRILEIDPMNADAYLGMAEAYIALGDIDNAIETLRTGLEQTGDDRIREKLNELLLSLALERGNTYLSEEKYPQAESEFADALDIDEKCIEAYLGKADSHIGADDIDKAIEVLQTGFDITSDSVIKEKLDALIEEQSKPKLLWSNVGGNVVYAKCGHYVKRYNDLWQPCDENGTPVTDKAYKYIENFCGTDEANYTVVTTEEGRVVCLDKNLTEIFEIEDADHYTIYNQESPTILTWHAYEYNSPATYLLFYTPEGKLLYTWNQDECIDGSGKPVYIDDPILMIPDNLKNYSDDIENHVNFKLDSMEIRLENVRISGSKLYLLFAIWLNHSYDVLNTQWTNHGDTSCVVMVSVNASVENDTVKMDRYDDYHDFEFTTWSGGYLCYESNDSRILQVHSATAHSEFILDSGNVRKAMITFYFGTSSKGLNGNQYTHDELNFYALNSFVNDQLMICQKPVSDDSKDNVYAVFRINWEDFESVDSSFDMHLDKEYNDKHERLTDFYDNISWNDEMLEMGYLLVSKTGKWGFVSVETGKEIAMYDDASSFLNGYAIVTNNSKGCVIDSEFNVVSDEFPCESASVSSDGSFTVKTGSETKRLVIKN